MGPKRFGVKRYEPSKCNSTASSSALHLEEQSHISYQSKSWIARQYGNARLCVEWYEQLPQGVKNRIRETGFQPFVQVLRKQLEYRNASNKYLLAALAEKWWDTTHTFHLDNIGELTLTPKDFSAITGLQVNGRRLKYDMKIYNKPNKMKTLVGEPLANLGKKRVTYPWIHYLYQNYECSTAKEEEILTRVFILVLLGSTIFRDKGNRVYLYYLPSLKKISSIAKYNWGGSALAFLYCNMDALCRGLTKSSGGYSKAWEIWACEYIPSLTRASTGANTFPRALCWTPQNVVSNSLAEYRVILKDLTFEQINSSPWGPDEKLPSYCVSSLSSNKKRILLESLAGRAWYLGERVSVQSMGTDHLLVPKAPPETMFSNHVISDEEIKLGFDGFDATQYLDDKAAMTYQDFREQFLSYNYSTEQEASRCGGGGEESRPSSTADEISIPPWTLIVPKLEENSNLLQLPNDDQVVGVRLPADIDSVSASTAAMLLQAFGDTISLLKKKLQKDVAGYDDDEDYEEEDVGNQQDMHKEDGEQRQENKHIKSFHKEDVDNIVFVLSDDDDEEEEEEEEEEKDAKEHDDNDDGDDDDDDDDEGKESQDGHQENEDKDISEHGHGDDEADEESHENGEESEKEEHSSDEESDSCSALEKKRKKCEDPPYQGNDPKRAKTPFFFGAPGPRKI